MSTTDDSDAARLRAGEFVLGTLEGSERDAFRADLAENRELQAEVHAWEAVLRPFADRVPAVDPPPEVWSQLSRRLDQLGEPTSDEFPQGTESVIAASSRDEDVEYAPATRPGSRSSVRSDRLRRWRATVLVAIAASVVLALVSLQRIVSTEPVPDYRGIAIVQNDDDEPLWVVDVAESPASVRITAFAPPSLPDDQVHQLWMALPDDQGVRSLGLLPARAGESLVRTLPQDALEILLSERTLGVSIEPAGGSPDAAPSGPVPYHPELQLLARPNDAV